MNQATLLFPGELLPYHVVDYALDWATENEGILKVLFFLPASVTPEGYPFPNDLDQAELLRNSFDAQEGLQEILKEERRYIEKRATARHVRVEVEILYSPKLSDIADRVKDADILFMDKNIDEKPEVFEELPFTLEELRETIHKILPVGEYDRYSDVVY